jgi:hypothetical protein
MKPRRTVLTPELERWLAAVDEGEAEEPAVATAAEGLGERRTVIVRLPEATDPEQAADQVRDAGATVQIAGAASITAVVTADALRRLVDEPWVVAIEEPRRLFPSTEPNVPDL